MRNKTVVYILIVCMSLGLCGCGKNIEGDIDSAFKQEISKQEASDTDDPEVEGTVQTVEIPDYYEYKMTDKKNHTFHINAEVNCKGINNMGVYSAGEDVIDEEFILELAGNIFDEGKYEIALPFFVMELDQIDAESYYSEYPGSYKNEQSTAIRYHDESQVQNFVEGKLLYDYTASAELVRAGAFYLNVAKEDPRKLARITGKINGEDFELSCTFSSLEEYPRIVLHAVNPYSIANGIYNSQLNQIPEDMQVNECDLDAATQLAEAFRDKMHFDDYKIKYVYPRIVGSLRKTNEKYLEGYRFVFVPTIDDISSTYSLCNIAYKQEGDNQINSGEQSALYIDVDSRGIAQMKMYNKYSVEEELSRNNELITLEQAVAVLEEALTESSDGLGMSMKCNTINLEYTYIKDNDKAAFVPMWVFYVSMSQPGFPTDMMSIVGVNAIDESMVEFYIDSNVNFLVE